MLVGQTNQTGRYRVKAAISVDHHVSDGADTAQFMQALAGFLEKSCEDIGVRNKIFEVK